MKVNIAGRGIIPGVGALAPIRDRELDIKQVRRILNYPAFKVYDATSGLLISKANVEKVFETHNTVKEAVREIKNKPITISTPIPEEPNVVEPTPVAEPVIEEVVEDTPVETVEETVEEVVEESTDDEDDTTKPNYYKKNKKKNRH